MKVKICGLKRAEDLKAARDADAVGFVVESPKSHRNLDVTEAVELRRLVPPFQAAVAVTATTDEKRLNRIMHSLRPNVLQIPAEVDGLVVADLQVNFPEVKIAVAIRPESYEPYLDAADAIVLDARTPDGYGGTGETLDLAAARKVVEATRAPVVLAGGLTPENVAQAIREVRPYAVDVSSGVETDKAKDAAKIAAFVRAARGALP
jgi:phosphoribosylanthranilate isomerase